MPPDFVSAGAVFFITVCTLPRGKNQLADPEAWAGIRAAAAHYHAVGRWHLRLFLAMPDHVHALASFPATETMARVVSAWKHFIGRRLGLVWQRDFFDHRLRTAASLDDKAHYIRLNPVRAGLVARPEAWPYVWSHPR